MPAENDVAELLSGAESTWDGNPHTDELGSVNSGASLTNLDNVVRVPEKTIFSLLFAIFNF